MLHEPYCMRTLKYCDKCQEAIEISEFEDHLESHKQKIKEPQKKEDTSSKSKEIPNQIKSNIKIPVGNDYDLKRLESAKITCEYCDLPVSYSEFSDHEAMCGARSTRCEYCDKNFLYNKMKSHLNDCNARIMLEQNAFEDDFIDEVALKNKKLQMEEDEKLAKLLANNSFSKENEDFELAKRMQMELDERLAREFTDENSNLNSNNNHSVPVNNEEEELDEELRRILQLSKQQK